MTAIDLYDEILVTAEIVCSHCQKVDTVRNTNDFSACDYFFKKGWRKAKVNCYCADCAKKKLKSKEVPKVRY